MATFRETVSQAKEKYFKRRYGDEQMYLQILGTHSDYGWRGYGKMLIRWGSEIASEDNVVVPLLGSPMGIGLYRVCVSGRRRSCDAIAGRRREHGNEGDGV